MFIVFFSIDGLQVATDDSDSECTVSDTHLDTKVSLHLSLYMHPQCYSMNMYMLNIAYGTILQEIAGAGLKDSDGSLKQVFESTAHKNSNTGKKIVADV